MSRKINFLGAHIRHVDLRMKEGQDYARMDISCDLTTTLSERLACPEAIEGDTFRRMNLDTEEIPLQELRMSMSGMEPHDLQILAHSAKDFVVVRSEDEGHTERQLRFHVVTPGGSIALIREYWSKIGEGKAKLTVTTLAESGNLDDQASSEQMTIAGAEETDGKKKRGRGKSKVATLPSKSQMDTRVQ